MLKIWLVWTLHCNLQTRADFVQMLAKSIVFSVNTIQLVSKKTVWFSESFCSWLVNRNLHLLDNEIAILTNYVKKRHRYENRLLVQLESDLDNYAPYIGRIVPSVKFLNLNLGLWRLMNALLVIAIDYCNELQSISITMKRRVDFVMSFVMQRVEDLIIKNKSTIVSFSSCMSTNACYKLLPQFPTTLRMCVMLELNSVNTNEILTFMMSSPHLIFGCFASSFHKVAIIRGDSNKLFNTLLKPGGMELGGQDELLGLLLLHNEWVELCVSSEAFTQSVVDKCLDGSAASLKCLILHNRSCQYVASFLRRSTKLIMLELVLDNRLGDHWLDCTVFQDMLKLTSLQLESVSIYGNNKITKLRLSVDAVVQFVDNNPHLKVLNFDKALWTVSERCFFTSIVKKRNSGTLSSRLFAVNFRDEFEESALTPSYQSLTATVCCV
jgi:hypothetical protein